MTGSRPGPQRQRGPRARQPPRRQRQQQRPGEQTVLEHGQHLVRAGARQRVRQAAGDHLASEVDVQEGRAVPGVLPEVPRQRHQQHDPQPAPQGRRAQCAPVSSQAEPQTEDQQQFRHEAEVFDHPAQAHGGAAEVEQAASAGPGDDQQAGQRPPEQQRRVQLPGARAVAVQELGGGEQDERGQQPRAPVVETRAQQAGRDDRAPGEQRGPEAGRPGVHAAEAIGQRRQPELQRRLVEVRHPLVVQREPVAVAQDVRGHQGMPGLVPVVQAAGAETAKDQQGGQHGQAGRQSARPPLSPPFPLGGHARLPVGGSERRLAGGAARGNRTAGRERPVSAGGPPVPGYHEGSSSPRAGVSAGPRLRIAS